MMITRKVIENVNGKQKTANSARAKILKD
jgi:hypothetical protein